MNDNEYYLFPTDYELRIIYFHALDAFSQYLHFFPFAFWTHQSATHLHGLHAY